MTIFSMVLQPFTVELRCHSVRLMFLSSVESDIDSGVSAVGQT